MKQPRTWQAISAGLAVVAISLAVVLATRGTDGHDQSSPSSTAVSALGVQRSNGITRAPLGEAAPSNAPGQTLYLQQVTIDPHAKLGPHYHQGTQVARVISGTLTYDIISGDVDVTRAGGQRETVTGPKKILLHPGDSLVETQTLVHFGANDTDRPVVIELTALLEQGAPLATPVNQ